MAKTKSDNNNNNNNNNNNQNRKNNIQEQLDLKPGQSIELLKALHILTADGKINQDSRRKLKQIYHLYQFIEPLLLELKNQSSINNMDNANNATIHLVDHGAGKSYLGFILYDLFYQSKRHSSDPSIVDPMPFHVHGIETKAELVQKSIELKNKLQFQNMSFMNLSVKDSMTSNQLPTQVDIVTALHACNTATDDAIEFALQKKSKHIVLVPCCQAEIAALLKQNKSKMLHNPKYQNWVELFRHPIHTREFGSHLTNVLRGLWLESNGYQVNITELVGWEHSMKNELIIASFNPNSPEAFKNKAKERLNYFIDAFQLQEISSRYLNILNDGIA